MNLADTIREVRKTHPADKFDLVMDEAGTIIAVVERRQLSSRPSDEDGDNDRFKHLRFLRKS